MDRKLVDIALILLQIVSTIDNSTIIHPFVDCFVDQVRVRALIDSGSMKSFISKSVQRAIDFDDLNLTKSKKEKCVSITGHHVYIEGHLSSTVKFLGSRACFNSEFLVSNNIPYECVLGWDFICQNNLSLCKDVKLGNYILVGKHAATPIINSQSSTTVDRAGVVQSTPQSVQVDSPVGRLLYPVFKEAPVFPWWRV